MKPWLFFTKITSRYRYSPVTTQHYIDYAYIKLQMMFKMRSLPTFRQDSHLINTVQNTQWCCSWKNVQNGLSNIFSQFFCHMQTAGINFVLQCFPFTTTLTSYCSLRPALILCYKIVSLTITDLLHMSLSQNYLWNLSQW